MIPSKIKELEEKILLKQDINYDWFIKQKFKPTFGTKFVQKAIRDSYKLGQKELSSEIEKVIDERINLWEVDEQTGYIICGAVLTELEELKQKLLGGKDD